MRKVGGKSLALEEDSILRKTLMGATIMVAAACLALAGIAYGAVQVAFNASVSPNKANKPAGLRIKITSSDPAAPQPPIMDRITIKLNAGGKYNGSKFPKCNLNSLQQKGPKGCPSSSKIGSGTGVGYAKPVVTDPVSAKLTVFNGGNKVFVYVFPDLGPTFVTVGNVIHKKNGPYDYTLDFAIPPIKTLPSAPDAATGTVKTSTKPLNIKKGKKKIGLIITPKTCKKTWNSTATFSFTTGEKVTVKSSQKCKK
jgi:hypothetical protein